MSKKMSKSQNKSGVSFLMQASRFYRDICPEQSRFLMQKCQMMSSEGEKVLPEELFCPFCFQWRDPDNHHVRHRPRRAASLRVQGVLRREGRGKRLSLLQRDLLRRYRNAPSYLMATCHACNKTSKYGGVNRDMLATLSRTSHTPGSAAKRKTPQSSTTTPKSVSKDKTPCSTPRSNSTASTSSTPASKPSSTKKSVFSRLRKFLLLDDSQKKKTTKGGLKDFLSSL